MARAWCTRMAFFKSLSDRALSGLYSSWTGRAGGGQGPVTTKVWFTDPHALHPRHPALPIPAPGPPPSCSSHHSYVCLPNKPLRALLPAAHLSEGPKEVFTLGILRAPGHLKGPSLQLSKPLVGPSQAPAGWGPNIYLSPGSWPGPSGYRTAEAARRTELAPPGKGLWGSLSPSAGTGWSL